MAEIKKESNAPPSELSNINTDTVGSTMPEVTLPNGKKVPTGTVGAMLINIRAYDKVVAEGGPEKEQYELEEKLLAAVPLLKAVGLFELFEPQEWISGGSRKSEGRKFVGEAALRS